MHITRESTSQLDARLGITPTLEYLTRFLSKRIPKVDSRPKLGKQTRLEFKPRPVEIVAKFEKGLVAQEPGRGQGGRADRHGAPVSQGGVEARRRTLPIEGGVRLPGLLRCWGARRDGHFVQDGSSPKAKKEEGTVSTSLRVTLFLGILQILQDKSGELLSWCFHTWNPAEKEKCPLQQGYADPLHTCHCSIRRFDPASTDEVPHCCWPAP